MADTVYKQIRKKHNMTRDEVCDRALALGSPIQPERLERIENGKFHINPDEVMLLAEIYGEPTLCNTFCSKECPIGEKYVPEIKVKELSQIVLEMLASLNSIDKERNRLIEITADGQITEDEYLDFANIQNQLAKISMSVDSLQLWMQKMIADGHIDKEKLDAARASLQ